MLDHNGERGIMATDFVFPGVAQLVGRQLWELEAARSNRATRTKTPLGSVIPEGVSSICVEPHYTHSGWE